MKLFSGYICVIYPLLFVLSFLHLRNTPPLKSTIGRYKSQMYLRNILKEQSMSAKNLTFIGKKAPMTSPFLDKESFLTMFTSFNSSMEKFYLYNNTLMNWMLMKPKVVLILFSDDASSKKHAKKLGWDLTLDIGLKACNGTPVLKDMFLTAQSHVNSKFYAYANADILFNRGLMLTLDALASNIGLNKKPFLLTGKRSDLLLNKHKITSIVGNKELDNAFMKSLISYGYAEDYFVVSKVFPWKIFPNLVIGRPMVDNYLVFITRRNRINTIDASATIGAIHQKTNSRKKIVSYCNKDILGKLWARRKMARGNVECSPFESRFRFDGNVTFMRRGTYTTAC